MVKYAFQGFRENMARAKGIDVGISSKVSIEIANHLRGRTTAEAKKALNRVLGMKEPVPFKRFTDGVGHRKIISGPGRYPQKASKEFLKLIEQAEANAQSKGLASDLRIIHLAAHRSSGQLRHGRQRRRTFKRTHLEIILEEIEKKPGKKQVVELEKEVKEELGLAGEKAQEKKAVPEAKAGEPAKKKPAKKVVKKKKAEGDKK